MRTFDIVMRLYYGCGALVMLFSAVRATSVFAKWTLQREQFITTLGKNHLPHIEKYLKLLCEKQGIPYVEMED